MLQVSAHANEDDYEKFRNECISLPNEISFSMPPPNLDVYSFITIKKSY